MYVFMNVVKVFMCQELHMYGKCTRQQPFSYRGFDSMIKMM